MHHLVRRRLIRDGKTVKHHVGIRHRLAVMARVGAQLGGMSGVSWSSRSAIGLLPRIWSRRGGLVDVASIAVIGRIIVVGQGAVGDAIVIEVESVRATLVVALVLDAAALTDELSTTRSRSHGCAAMREMKEATEGALWTRGMGCDETWLSCGGGGGRGGMRENNSEASEREDVEFEAEDDQKPAGGEEHEIKNRINPKNTPDADGNRPRRKSNRPAARRGTRETTQRGTKKKRRERGKGKGGGSMEALTP
jgi:hypothetical protein